MSSMSLYRLCLDTGDLVLSPDNPKHGSGTFITNEKPSFSGSLVDIQSLGNDIIFGLKTHSSFNFTLIQATKTESYNGLTGCHLSLFRNQSDIYIQPTPYLIGEESIDFLSILGQTSIEFLTGYSSSDSSFDGDVTESFSSFSVTNLLVIFLVFVVLLCFLKLSHKLVRKKKRTKNRNLTFKVFSHFLMKDFLAENISKSCFQFTFILTLFSYVTFIFFNSVIKTDLVYVPKPYVPYSYQDIINNKTAWIWFSADLELLIKRSSLRTTDRSFYDSVEERNWKHFDKKYKENNKNMDPISVLIFDTLNLLSGIWIEFASATSNIFKLKIICSTKAHLKDNNFQTLVGNLYPQTKHLYPWASSDENTNYFLAVFAKRSAFTPDVKLKRRSQRIFEAGVQVMFEGKSESTNDRLIDVLPGLENRNQEIRECLSFSRKLKMKEVGFVPLKVVNFLRIWYFNTLLFSCSLIALIREIIKKNKK